MIIAIVYIVKRVILKTHLKILIGLVCKKKEKKKKNFIYNNIFYLVPEGGGGPKYQMT